jgi:hypothetical protein
MPYEFYLFLHFIGIFFILVSLGGLTLHIVNGGTREFKARKFMMMTHGIGLLITIIAGFGLLARLRMMSPIPSWAYEKMGIWLVLGILPAAIYRKPDLAKIIWFMIILLAGVAAWLAIHKPIWQ